VQAAWHRANTGDCQPRILDNAAVTVELHQHSQADGRNDQRATMADFFEAAAKAGERVALEAGDQFAVGQRGLAGAGDEFTQWHAALCDFAVLRRGQFDDGVVRLKTRRGVRRRRGVDNIAADRG
jgi:hypothetical protein